MNWNSFNTLGYLSVILWIAMPVLWFLHARMRPRRWLCHIALLLGVAALVLAKINSVNHVNRIQPDRTEQLAALAAEKQEKRQAAIDSRGENVADIRFAEDGSDDHMDRAGMDEAELKYTDKLDNPDVPEWKKKEKRVRSGDNGEDDSLEGAIGANEKREDLATEALEGAVGEEPIIMNAKDLDMANRLDSMNLNATRILLLVALTVVAADYFRRANVYREAYLPLPLPSPWLNASTPLEAIFEQPEPARRSVAEELAWMTRRGDAFLYLAGNPQKVSQLPQTLPRLGKKRRVMELLRIDEYETTVSDDFVFEALWYGRSSFVSNSKERAMKMLGNFLKLLADRKETRAHVAQTVHIVWDLDEPVPDPIRDGFAKLGRDAGFSLFICSPQKSQPQPR